MYNTQNCHVQSWLSCTILIVMYNPDCHVQSPGLSCTILIVMYNPDCHVQSPGLSCTILIVMYNPDVQSWLSCTIPRIVMYNPDCHVQSWCTILIVMYNPDVQSWLSCTILIVMYNPDVQSCCHVQSWLSCTILMYNPDCHVQSPHLHKLCKWGLTFQIMQMSPICSLDLENLANVQSWCTIPHFSSNAKISATNQHIHSIFFLNETLNFSLMSSKKNWGAKHFFLPEIWNLGGNCHRPFSR